MKLFYKEYLDSIVYLARNDAYKIIDSGYEEKNAPETANTSLSTVLRGLTKNSEGYEDFKLDPIPSALLSPKKQMKKKVSFLPRKYLKSVIQKALKQSMGSEWYNHYETLRRDEEELDEICLKRAEVPNQKAASNLYPAQQAFIYPSNIQPIEYYRIKNNFFERLSRHIRGEGVENKQLNEKFMSHAIFKGTEDELLDTSKEVFTESLSWSEFKRAMEILKEQVSFVHFSSKTVEERLDGWLISKEHIPIINSTVILQEIANITEGNILRQAFKCLYLPKGGDSRSKELLFAFKMHATIIKSILAAEPKVKEIEASSMHKERHRWIWT